MKMCDLNTGSTRLMRAAKYLKEQWAEAKEHWTDGTSQKFEKTFLEPLAPDVQLVIAAVQRLAEVLERAEKECDENREQGL